MADESFEKALRASIGYAVILRRHSAEADRAASSEIPDKWVADKLGWETLRDQLRDAAIALEGMAFLLPLNLESEPHQSDNAEVIEGCPCRICSLHRELRTCKEDE